MRTVFPVLVAMIALSGCEEEPGVCEERRVFNSVKEGFCVEMDSPAQCPIAESGDKSEEYQWRWYPGKKCPQIGYDFGCGAGVFVDLESRCGGE